MTTIIWESNPIDLQPVLVKPTQIDEKKHCVINQISECLATYESPSKCLRGVVDGAFGSPRNKGNRQYSMGLAFGGQCRYK